MFNSIIIYPYQILINQKNTILYNIISQKFSLTKPDNELKSIKFNVKYLYPGDKYYNLSKINIKTLKFLFNFKDFKLYSWNDFYILTNKYVYINISKTDLIVSGYCYISYNWSIDYLINYIASEENMIFEKLEKILKVGK